MFRHQSIRIRAAFTLIEVIVVIGIVALLMGLLLPAVQAARESARRVSCSNNQRQVILALHSHETAHRCLPPTLSSKRENLMLFWQARVLPFLEQEPLFVQVRREVRSGVHVYYNTHRTTIIPSLQCASNPDTGRLVKPDLGWTFAFTDYCGVGGSDRDNGVFRLDISEVNRNGVFLSQVTGGLSNTLIFGERPPSDLDEGFGAWIGGQRSEPASTYTNGSWSSFSTDLLRGCGDRTDLGFQRGIRGSRCDWTHHWSYHPEGAYFARADGSIEFVSYAIDKEVLAELASRD